MRPPFLITAATSAPAILLACLSALTTSMGAEPTADDMEHGRKQVELMLLDRPGMVVYRLEKDARAGYLTPSDPMYQWAQAAFAGKHVGQRILWDRRPLPEGTEGRYTTPLEDQQPYTLSINDQTGISHHAFDRMWAALVYEVLNMIRSAQRVSNKDAAAAGKITADAYVEESARLHWKIQDEQDKFYETDWFPWATALGMETSREVWTPRRPATFDEWFAGTLKQTPSPWYRHYKRYETLQKQAAPAPASTSTSTSTSASAPAPTPPPSPP